MKRFLVVADVQSLFYGTRNSFGSEAKIDYVKLRNFIIEQEPDAKEEDFIFTAYVIEIDTNGGFLDVLRENGYKVISRKKRDPQHYVRMSANMTADALAEMYTNEDLEAIYFLSVDEAVHHVTRYARKEDVDIILCYPLDNVHDSLKSKVTRTIDIEEDMLFES